MVALPSDTIALPLLPRIIPRLPETLGSATKNIVATKNRRFSQKGLSIKAKIIVAVVSAVVVIIIVVAIIIISKWRRRRAARAPKDVLSASSSSSSSSSFVGGNNGFDPNAGVGFPPPEHTLGPRPLESHLSPETGDMHEVPLSAEPRYGYGAQVDGLRIPGMKPVYSGYNQVPVSRFSPS